MDQFKKEGKWINSVLGFHELRNFGHWVSKHCCSSFRRETHSFKCSKTIDLTPVGNIENLVSSFSADFSHMIDLTDFVIIANESRGMNLAIQ